MVADLAVCIRTDLHCADFCAEECEHHAGMPEHCRICAEACRRCENACAALLDSMV